MDIFLDRLQTCAEVSGWKSICKVNGKSLFTEYGMISVEECKNSAKKYFALDKQCNIKTSQDMALPQQMIVCIKQSITNECAMKVQTSGEESKIKVSNGAYEDEFQDGPLYLKIMISRITIDSRSMVTYICSALSELDHHMVKCGNDATKFNDFMRMKLDALKARGKSSNDIMVNFFKGNKTISNGHSSNT